ncbi:MAG: HNH endonuclease [Planctomycetota bacterium]
MHREICCAPRGVVVDHIDGNGLNNRKSNLRLCTVRQNLWNRRPAGGTSLYKGVCWRAEKKKWAARITCRDRRHHLGYFDTEMEAADAYDKKAAALFGEFAYLNFPNQSQPPNKFGG